MESATFREILLAMSQENVEIVRRLYDAWNADDMAVLADLLDAEFEWRPVLGTAGARATVYRGPDGFLAYRDETEEVVGHIRAEPASFEPYGDLVFVRLIARVQGSRSGVETSARLFHLWALRDGTVVRGTSFERESEALEAAGLQK